MDEIADVAIVPIADHYIAGYNRCVDAVARERRYVGLVEGPTMEQSRDFVHRLLADGGVQYVAIDQSDHVVGWCDIVRHRLLGFRHCGTLGMGVLVGYRGRGLGRRLANAAISAAIAQGIQRIELAVFASNASAIALYERLGFVREGVQRRARYLDGEYEDNLLMALFADSAQPSRADASP